MATTTPNFGWSVPTSTDLVKDGATAIETLGDSIDASLLDLKGGTAGQVLAKNSGTDMDFVWTNGGDITAVTAGTGISGGGTSGDVTVTNSMATAIDAKGDLIGGTGADTFARLAVGANDTVLTADSTAATGLKWAAPAAANGPAFFGYRGTSNQSISQNVITKVSYNAEVYDTDSCFNISTGRFTPTKAGKYQINVNLGLGMNATGRALFKIYKNGNAFINGADFGSGTSDFYTSGSCLIDMNGSTDYLEVFAMGSASTNSLAASSGASSEQYNVFSGTWVRS
jgi:hypothetical protein